MQSLRSLGSLSACANRALAFQRQARMRTLTTTIPIRAPLSDQSISQSSVPLSQSSISTPASASTTIPQSKPLSSPLERRDSSGATQSTTSSDPAAMSDPAILEPEAPAADTILRTRALQSMLSTSSSTKRVQGRVISAGKMSKTVRVRIAGQVWNKKLQKYFRSHTNVLVHDPNSSLREGDIVLIAPFDKNAAATAAMSAREKRIALAHENGDLDGDANGSRGGKSGKTVKGRKVQTWRSPSLVRHIVKEILVPFGTRIEDRPRLTTG